MILPMMGLLNILFVLGPIAGVIAFLFPPIRRFAPFVFATPMFVSIVAFLSCWGFAIGLEKLLQSQTAGGMGFFGGYCFGGLAGGILGYRLFWPRSK